MQNPLVNDLAGLSEPLKKLIEVTASGVGKLYEPFHIKRVARAEAEAKIIATKAEINTAEIHERASARAEFKRIRQQANIESIAAKTAKFLPAQVSTEAVDPDWSYGFFEECQDTTNNELQELWAKILAGEVTRPGSCSKKTLRIVRQMEKSDAERFTRFCALVVDTNLASFALAPEGRGFLPFGLSAFDLSELGQLELLISDNVSTEITEGFHFGYFGQLVVVRVPDSRIVRLPFVPLTERGKELRRVCDIRKNSSLLPYLAERIRKENPNATIQLIMAKQ